MTRLTTGFHPDFDALSAHADRSDTEAARTKVSRHVSGCEKCRATVEEIRALGSAARQSVAPGVPAGMWTRIEQQLQKGEPMGGAMTQADREIGVDAAKENMPRPDASDRSEKSSVARRTLLGLAAFLAVISTVLVLDSREPLAAATPRRLTTDREAARPGEVITFHYRPIPALAGQRSLTIWMILPNRGMQRFDQALERGGVLRRVSGLEFTGTVAMPDSTPLAMFIVGDSTGDIIDRTELRANRLPSVVLSANSHGQPRLDAFVLALGGGRGSSDPATMTRWATQMHDLYPSAPETWILTALYARRSVIGDIVKLFESKERQYYGWHDRLEHRTGLSEETETMMATLGWELMDTARAEFWTTRLMHDHPESPSAPSLWIDRYRDVPDDSAALVLQAFEPIYTRPRQVQGRALERALMLAARSGDSALMQRWHLRTDPRNMSWVLGSELANIARDPVALAELRRRLQVALLEADSAEHAGPTLWGSARLFAWYDRQRVGTRLAALQLIDGDAKGAKAVLDSIAHDMAARPTCPMPETLRWRAEASRQLGLMADARADLAYVVVTGDWRRQVLSDSVPALLGPAYTKASWDSALAEANRLKQKCWADSRDARRHGGG
jgi:hypothetical protein